METHAVGESANLMAIFDLNREVQDRILRKAEDVPLLFKLLRSILIAGAFTEAQLKIFDDSAPDGEALLREFIIRRMHSGESEHFDLKDFVWEYVEGFCRF